jgi:hypothetical protein
LHRKDCILFARDAERSGSEKMGKNLTLQEKVKIYRQIFNVMYWYPRIYGRAAYKRAELKQNIYGPKLIEALKYQYIVGPCLKKKSFENLVEIMYFIKCKNPRRTNFDFREDNNIVYHARLDGFCNLWTISKERIAVDGDVLIEGLPTDYHVSFPPDWTWDMGFNSMRNKIEAFNPDAYTPKYILTNHWDETVEWTELDEILYREFKYNIRKPIAPIMKKYNIQRATIKEWLKNVHEYCDICTYFYPASISEYDSYIYMFETDYEDFIIEVFSQLPTSALFFKIKDITIAYICFILQN